MSETEKNDVPDHGIPEGMGQDEPKGMPSSDRHHSENAASDNGGGAAVEKHKHTP
jgi:hypothetical protein